MLKRRSLVACGLALPAGATLVLDANPTTGYQWEPATEPDAAVMKIVSDTYEAGGSDAMGAGGTQRIVIEGVAAGTATLELRYVRPWEADAPPAELALAFAAAVIATAPMSALLSQQPSTRDRS